MFVDTPPDIEELSVSTSKNGTPSGTGARGGVRCLNEATEAAEVIQGWALRPRFSVSFARDRSPIAPTTVPAVFAEFR